MDTYHELDDLARLSLPELQALWDSVPVEQQAYLTRVFEREASKRQIVEDLDEARMAHYFLTQYRTLGFVPAGEVWLKVPLPLREQYKKPIEKDPETDKTRPQRPILPLLLLLGVPFLCFLLFIGVRLASGGTQRVARPTLTPSPSPTVTPSPTLTPTLPVPSPTPFALTGFDSAIQAGSRSSKRYYPVQLQIFTTRTAQPRLFIVQEQLIGVAEWGFSPEPDVVSWLSGMVIKPVLGVPFSPSNLALFRALGQESVFVVTMNTGNVLQFTFERMTQVPRTDTTSFQQDSPSLVLVLVGETSTDGLPTDLRYVVHAHYPPDQETARLTSPSSQRVPLGVEHDFGSLSLTVQRAQRLTSAELPQGWRYWVLEAQLTTGENGFLTDSLVWHLDIQGERFLPEQKASQSGACPPIPPVLPPNSTACFSVGFLVHQDSFPVRLFVGTANAPLREFQAE